MSEILAVRDVVKVFGDVRAVDGVSFTVRRGTITGLLGRNGAGKTTTIRMITGIFMPDSGDIQWLGGGDGSGTSFRDRIGHVIRERFKILGQVKALTAEGRLQGLTLLVLPFVMFAAMMVVNRSYAEVLFQHVGLLVATGVSMLVGALWIRKIVNFEA